MLKNNVSSSAASTIITPARSGRRFCCSRRMFVWNMLLALGVFVEMVQIYRTSSHTVDSTFDDASFHMAHNNNYSNNGRHLKMMAQAQPKMMGQTAQRRPGDNPRAKWDTDRFRGEGGQFDFKAWRAAVDARRRERGLPPVDRTSARKKKKKNMTPYQAPKYNYSAPAVSSEYTLTTEPNPTNDTIAILVLSARGNFAQRKIIRETWAKGYDNVFFVIGGAEPEDANTTIKITNETTLPPRNRTNPKIISQRLFQEQEQHHDILDTIHPDTYQGLPYKVLFSIRWVANHPAMKHVQWVAKVDDDVVVRQNNMHHWVLRKYNPSIPLIVGRVERTSTPHLHGKWAENPDYVQRYGKYYPPWLYGSAGYVLSRPVVDYIGSTPESNFWFLQGEDVSMGLWLFESPLEVRFIDAPGEFHMKGCAVNEDGQDHHQSAVIGHALSPNEIKACYEDYKDPIPLPFHHEKHMKQKSQHIYTTVRTDDYRKWKKLRAKKNRVKGPQTYIGKTAKSLIDVREDVLAGMAKKAKKRAYPMQNNNKMVAGLRVIPKAAPGATSAEDDFVPGSQNRNVAAAAAAATQEDEIEAHGGGKNERLWTEDEETKREEPEHEEGEEVDEDTIEAEGQENEDVEKGEAETGGESDDKRIDEEADAEVLARAGKAAGFASGEEEALMKEKFGQVMQNR